MDPSLAPLVTLSFDRQRLIAGLEGIGRRYDMLRRLAAGMPKQEGYGLWIQLLVHHPGAVAELEYGDHDSFVLRQREAEEERAALVAQAALPPAPRDDERVRPLALAELEWVLLQIRSTDRRRPTSPPPELIELLGPQVGQIKRFRRRREVLAALAKRYARPDLATLLFPQAVGQQLSPVTVESDKLVEGQPLQVEAFGRTLAVVRSEGCVYAVDDTCPHRGGPLGKGELDDGHLLCPLHGWAFNLSTGQMKGNAAVRVATYEVEEREEHVVLLPPRR